MKSSTYTFGGANIKGTPAMKPHAVLSDVRKISKVVDVLVVQEFKWRWYWTIIRSVMGTAFASAPGFAKGIKDPEYGAQGVFWKRASFSKVAVKVVPAFNFKSPRGDIMGERWIRSVKLREKATGLQCWFVSMHAVVGGDSKDDEQRRQQFMKQNLNRLKLQLEFLTRTDTPIVFEADMNIRPGSWAFVELMEIINKHHGRIVGVKGIEYLVVFDRHGKTKVVVEDDYVLDPKKAGLNTDHEVRCMEFHLVCE